MTEERNMDTEEREAVDDLVPEGGMATASLRVVQFVTSTGEVGYTAAWSDSETATLLGLAEYAKGRVMADMHFSEFGDDE